MVMQDPIETESDDTLTAYLRDRDVACPACGYNLRGLTANRCPECEMGVVLSVQLAEPPIVPYVLAVVGLASSGAAFGVALLCVLAISLFKLGPPRGEEAVLLLVMPVLVLLFDIPAVMGLLNGRARRRFNQATKSARWKLVAACWSISLAIVVVWLLAFFVMA